MTDIFEHRFGGWHTAQARRWINYDGSPGGIVAISATVYAATRLPEGVEVWPNAKIIGYRASIGNGAIIGYRASIGDGAIIDYRASIGNRASIGDGAIIGYRASIGDGAIIGYRASVGNRASIEADDWLFVAGPQGSRGAWATAVFSATHGLRWWVGCQHGLNSDELRERVLKQHIGAVHCEDYLYLIDMVEAHPGLKHARAAVAAKKDAGSQPTSGLIEIRSVQ